MIGRRLGVPAGEYPVDTAAGGNVRGLLGMTTRAAWLIVGLFLVSKTVQVVMVAGDVHPQWPSVLLLIVLALCCLALLAVSADPLPWPLTVAMAVVVLYSLGLG